MAGMGGLRGSMGGRGTENKRGGAVFWEPLGGAGLACALL